MSMVIVGGGHGVGVLGMFMWRHTALAIGLGLCLLVSALTGLIRTDVIRCSLLLLCLASLLAVWACLIAFMFNGWIIASLISSTPFLALALMLTVHIVKGLNATPSPAPQR